MPQTVEEYYSQLTGKQKSKFNKSLRVKYGVNEDEYNKMRSFQKIILNKELRNK